MSGAIRTGQPIVAEADRLLRWYPASWRAANAQAVVGVLLDQAEATGSERLDGPTRWNLRIGGIRERYRSAYRGRLVNPIALGAAAALATVYLTGVLWSPEFRGAGALFGFSNPAAIPAAALILAFACAALSFARASRILAAAGILGFIGITLAGEFLGWMGPSWLAAALFSGLAGLGIVRTRSRKGLALYLGAWLALAVLLALSPLVENLAASAG